MSEERLKVLEMLSSGTITVAEANELLKSFDGANVEVNGKIISEPQALKEKLGKFFYINVVSKDGDRVNITLPMALIKTAIKIGTVQNLLDKSVSGSSTVSDMVDIDLIIQCIESGVIGDIVNIESKDGDKVRIYVE